MKEKTHKCMWDKPKNHAKILEKQKSYRYAFYDIETMQARWDEEISLCGNILPPLP